ncbi:MAG: HEAT repeat domain-containing protein [Polyangiales bacterium]
MRCKFARCLALAASLASPAAATPWSASVGVAPRVAALRAPEAAARADAAWWIYEHAPDSRVAGENPTDALRLALAHERDPAAALAEVSALARLTRGTHEGALRLTEALGNGLIPDLARRAALRALTLQLDADQLGEILARAAPARAVDTSLTRLAARGLAAQPTALLSAALQQTAANPQRRAVVIRALGEHGDPRWSGAVFEALDAPRSAVFEPLTAAAIDAVASLRLVEAAPRLCALAADERLHGLRARAVRALGSLGGAFDPAVLARAMAAPLTRVAALEAAAALGDRALAPACAAYLDAPVSHDRAAAARCLRALGGADVDRLLRARRARESSDAVLDVLDEALGEAAAGGFAGGTPALVRALAEARVEGDRVRAVEVLGERAVAGDLLAAEALAALVRRERDLPSPAALAAMRAAARAGAPVDDETLRAWLSSADPLARQSAAHAAGALGGRGSRAALRAMALREVDDDARQAATVALARLEGAEALPMLERMSETAFSVPQLDAVAHARRIAAGAPTPRAPLAAPISLPRRGFVPGSVWATTLPDGGLALGAAGDDGVLRIAGGATAGALRRVDQR